MPANPNAQIAAARAKNLQKKLGERGVRIDSALIRRAPVTRSGDIIDRRVPYVPTPNAYAPGFPTYEEMDRRQVAYDARAARAKKALAESGQIGTHAGALPPLASPSRNTASTQHPLITSAARQSPPAQGARDFGQITTQAKVYIMANQIEDRLGEAQATSAPSRSGPIRSRTGRIRGA